MTIYIVWSNGEDSESLVAYCLTEADVHHVLLDYPQGTWAEMKVRREEWELWATRWTLIS